MSFSETKVFLELKKKKKSFITEKLHVTIYINSKSRSNIQDTKEVSNQPCVREMLQDD